MSRDEPRLVGQSYAAFLFKDSKRGNGVGHDRRLGILGEGELILRAIGHDAEQALA